MNKIDFTKIDTRHSTFNKKLTQEIYMLGRESYLHIRAIKGLLAYFIQSPHATNTITKEERDKFVKITSRWDFICQYLDKYNWNSKKFPLMRHEDDESVLRLFDGLLKGDMEIYCAADRKAIYPLQEYVTCFHRVCDLISDGWNWLGLQAEIATTKEYFDDLIRVSAIVQREAKKKSAKRVIKIHTPVKRISAVA